MAPPRGFGKTSASRLGASSRRDSHSAIVALSMPGAPSRGHGSGGGRALKREISRRKGRAGSWSRRGPDRWKRCRSGPQTVPRSWPSRPGRSQAGQHGGSHRRCSPTSRASRCRRAEALGPHRWGRHGLAVQVVAHAETEGVQAVEPVRLGHAHAGDAVDVGGPLERRQVGTTRPWGAWRREGGVGNAGSGVPARYAPAPPAVPQAPLGQAP